MDSTVFHEMLLLVFPDEQDSHIPSPCAETSEESNKKLNPENACSFKLSFISYIIYIFKPQMDKPEEPGTYRNIYIMNIFNENEFKTYLWSSG
jgi:hypothetical protein